jgi:hypothetical protein
MLVTESVPLWLLVNIISCDSFFEKPCMRNLTPDPCVVCIRSCLGSTPDLAASHVSEIVSLRCARSAENETLCDAFFPNSNIVTIEQIMQDTPSAVNGHKVAFPNTAASKRVAKVIPIAPYPRAVGLMGVSASQLRLTPLLIVKSPQSVFQLV